METLTAIELKKARANERAKQWYSAHKERKAEYDRAYSKKNRKRRRETGLAYYYRNKDKARQWELRNPEKAKASKRKRAIANRDHLNALIKRRRARLAKCKSDSTAEAFYAFVRSKAEIPCYYCGEVISGKDAHIDHVIAVTKQGNHASENLCASCQRCNQRKGNKLPSEIKFLSQKLLDL